MAAPVVLAGLGIAAGIGAVLGIKALGQTKLYAVTFICPYGTVKGRTFPDLPQAEAFQAQLAQKGVASIIVEKQNGNYQGVKAVKAVDAEGQPVPAQDLQTSSFVPRWGGGRGFSRRGAGRGWAWGLRRNLMLRGTEKDLIGSSRNFDTREEQLLMTQATTRQDTPESAIRARQGPFPETDPGRQEDLVEVPLFRQTTSSHEWKTRVRSHPVPERFFPGRQMVEQPDELVVRRRPQYPEEEGE